MPPVRSPEPAGARHTAMRRRLAIEQGAVHGVYLVPGAELVRRAPFVHREKMEMTARMRRSLIRRPAWHAKRLLPALLWIVLSGTCGDVPHTVTQERHSIPLGDDTVTVVVHRADVPGLTLINLHDNEDTAVEAALEVIGRRGGRCIELRHTGDRNVSFALDGRPYTFDPNRIFTPTGVDSTLAALSTSSGDARRAVHAFADTLRSLFDLSDLDVVVTVHNNTEGDYSVHSYRSGGAYEVDARFAHVIDGMDPDDFFFVTDVDVYTRLRREGANVVLQDNAVVTDDGSLSVYCARHEVPYVNVEAQHGHFAAQVRMLELLHHVLRERP